MIRVNQICRRNAIFECHACGSKKRLKHIVFKGLGAGRGIIVCEDCCKELIGKLEELIS